MNNINLSDKVTIIGGGHQGLAMTAHLSLNGIDCYLWNRTEKNIKSVIDSRQIYCRGVVNGVAKVKYASGNIKECLQKLIMVTVPSNAHEDIARLLAPYVDETYTIVLNPGRTFGARAFLQTLKDNKCESLPLVAETETIIYTCRRDCENGVFIYALKEGVAIATGLGDVNSVIKSLPRCIQNHFIPVSSDLVTSFNNKGMILHCAPVLMNIGWIESEKTEFKYYYDGISPTIATILEKLDDERRLVARVMGVEVESLKQWLIRTYNTHGENLFECLQNNNYYREIDAPLSIKHRYIEEDVPNGLVPIENVADVNGISVPTISLIIDLANLVMQKDYRKEGRKYFRYEDKECCE